VISWGRFEKGNEFLALHEFKLGRLYGCPAAKGAPLRLPAHRAMAVHSAGQPPVDLVLDAAAQAASAQHAHLSMNKSV
jgi:hypothetical protein